MLPSTLRDQPDTRADQARVDAAARRLLSTVCAPVTFDRDALERAVHSYPARREPGQDALSWSDGPAPSQARVGLGFREGRTFRVELGPGVACLRSYDACRRERAGERLTQARIRRVDLAAAMDGDFGDEGPARGEITSWSRRSRSRMVKAFGSVDWGSISRCYCGELMDQPVHTEGRCSIGQPMPLAMLTLTYPGDWLAVCRSGKKAKKHLRALRKRFARATGWALEGAWKEEFQRARLEGGSEGQPAPHFHLLVPVPAHVAGDVFSVWLARTWADVVGASGAERAKHERKGTWVSFSETARMTDIKRCAVYFLKHGTHGGDDKEYQHNVPDAWREPGEGPGRFWGFWGLKNATVPLDLDQDDFWTARRVLRKVLRARQRKIAFQRNGSQARRPIPEGSKDRLTVAGGAWVPLGKRVWTLGVGGQASGGWVVLNDGVKFAAQLAQALALRRSLY